MFIVTLTALTAASFQQSEPVISNDTISIHTVQRGDMRLHQIVQGAITSIEPTTANVSAPVNAADHLRIGQAIEFEFQGRRIAGKLPILTGSVARLEGSNGGDRNGYVGMVRLCEGQTKIVPMMMDQFPQDLRRA